MTAFKKTILTCTGLVLGGLLTWLRYNHHPSLSLQDNRNQAMPRYEVWTKQNSCGAIEERYDATLLLRLHVPEADIGEIGGIEIYDGGTGQTSTLLVNRADLNANGPGGWTPDCEDGDCKFSIFYPAHRNLPDGRDERRYDYRVYFKDRSGERREMAYFPDTQVPNPAISAALPRAPLNAQRDDEALMLSFVPNFDIDGWVTVALRDGYGERTGEFTLPAKARGPLELSVELTPQVEYAQASLNFYDA